VRPKVKLTPRTLNRPAAPSPAAPAQGKRLKVEEEELQVDEGNRGSYVHEHICTLFVYWPIGSHGCLKSLNEEKKVDID